MRAYLSITTVPVSKKPQALSWDDLDDGWKKSRSASRAAIRAEAELDLESLSKMTKRQLEIVWIDDARKKELKKLLPKTCKVG